MANPVIFQNYDLEEVYTQVQAKALGANARNFVVDFGQTHSSIAFDLELSDFETLFKKDSSSRSSTPVRWINIWAPDAQSKIIKFLAAQYGLSNRTCAILCTAPSRVKRTHTEIKTKLESNDKTKSKLRDLELANGPAVYRPAEDMAPEETNHYSIASYMNNYQSLDIGEKFICVGANWMHPLLAKPKKEGEKQKAPTVKRLWAWLMLCDDGTVIQLHEDPGKELVDEAYIKAVRAHTLLVLSQLSVQGYPKAGSVSMVSIRQPLIEDGTSNVSAEGSGNLFYYLFDDWHATFVLIKTFHMRLEILSKQILAGLNPATKGVPAEVIIPELYAVGKELRANLHRYEGYNSLIDRILKFQVKDSSSTSSDDPSATPPRKNKRITVALTASERFERLRDRISLLVLSSLKETNDEKDALINTYFSITAQTDSKATAKLNSSTALLSKLGVLFLPVSLMTSYFSVQIQELQGVYTAETYWVAFAVLLSLSFLAVFIFSRWLGLFGRVMDLQARRLMSWAGRGGGKTQGRAAQVGVDEDAGADDEERDKAD